MEAIIENTCLPQECSDADRAEAEVLRHVIDVRIADAKRSKARREARQAPRTAMSMIGASIFISPDVDRSNLSLNQAHETQSLSNASFIVVPDPNSPNPCTQIAAQLQGAWLCTADFVQSSGVDGLGFNYKRQVSVPRQIWISASFKRFCPRLFGIIGHCTLLPCSRWKLICSRRKLLELTLADLEKPKRSQRPFDRIAIVTGAEQRSPNLSFLRNVFSVPLLVKFFNRDVAIDTQAIGMCRR